MKGLIASKITTTTAFKMSHSQRPSLKRQPFKGVCAARKTRGQLLLPAGSYLSAAGIESLAKADVTSSVGKPEFPDRNTAPRIPAAPVSFSSSWGTQLMAYPSMIFLDGLRRRDQSQYHGFWHILFHQVLFEKQLMFEDRGARKRHYNKVGKKGIRTC